jgi:hypothetical protein
MPKNIALLTDINLPPLSAHAHCDDRFYYYYYHETTTGITSPFPNNTPPQTSPISWARPLIKRVLLCALFGSERTPINKCRFASKAHLPLADLIYRREHARSRRAFFFSSTHDSRTFELRTRQTDAKEKNQIHTSFQTQTDLILSVQTRLINLRIFFVYGYVSYKRDGHRIQAGCIYHYGHFYQVTISNSY